MVLLENLNQAEVSHIHTLHVMMKIIQKCVLHAFSLVDVHTFFSLVRSEMAASSGGTIDQ